MSHRQPTSRDSLSVLARTKGKSHAEWQKIKGGGALRSLSTPLKLKDIERLKAGDLIKITGEIFTARDQVYAQVLRGKTPPADMRNGVVYHCGPLVEKKGLKYEILSAGPTTSSRLDPMQVAFVRRTGVRAIIGKGGVEEEVAEGLRKAGCIYLAFTGGAGVLAALKIQQVRGVYWKDFGEAEAFWILNVKDFGPLVVAIDLHGKNLYRKT